MAHHAVTSYYKNAIETGCYKSSRSSFLITVRNIRFGCSLQDGERFQTHPSASKWSRAKRHLQNTHYDLAL